MISAHSFVRSFGLGCVTEVRKRSNETWLKIDYGQLHIGIESMWLRRVYFVLSKFLRTKILSPKRQTVFLKRHYGFFAISCSDTESTSARLESKLTIFVRADLLESPKQNALFRFSGTDCTRTT
jgi:hypothetical protein